MKFDERHLVQLAAVVEAGGVTEGAALLGTSQPAISRTLAMIEKRVGEPLFVAGRRPLQPTALGKQSAVHGKAILAASRKATETVASFRGGTSGRVRIGGVPFFMDAVVSGVIASFQMQQPNILFEQSYGHYNDLVSSLLANEIDVAVLDAGPHQYFDDAWHWRIVDPLCRRLAAQCDQLSCCHAGLGNHAVVGHPLVATRSAHCGSAAQHSAAGAHDRLGLSPPIGHGPGEPQVLHASSRQSQQPCPRGGAA